MLEKFPKPFLLAHRGASTHAPENTLPAFELALEEGANGVELDAKLSADGQVVVIHLGSNGRFTATQFDDMMQVLAGVHRVVFVNVRVPRTWEESNNQVLFWCQIGQLDGYYAMQVSDPVDQKREFVDDILSR